MAVNYRSTAKKRWPGCSISGSGQFAVLTCSFWHPSGDGICYSDVYLFESRKEAEDFKASLDTGVKRRCHAQTENMCGGTHPLLVVAEPKTQAATG